MMEAPSSPQATCGNISSGRDDSVRRCDTTLSARDFFSRRRVPFLAVGAEATSFRSPAVATVHSRGVPVREGFESDQQEEFSVPSAQILGVDNRQQSVSCSIPVPWSRRRRG